MLHASGVLTLASDEDTLLAEAQGTFLTLPDEAVDLMMKDNPGLRRFFA